MKLLIKFPTRQRPEKFLARLEQYWDLMKEPELCQMVVTADLDDPTMYNPEMQQKVEAFPNTRIHYGDSKNKIAACNADIPREEAWDILLLASDDMEPMVRGYDRIIREKMEQHYPDTDGVLHFNDGAQGEKLNTLSILGRKYYDRFGYIYHPDYVSFYCDNEFTQVSRHLNKATYFPEVIIRHRHFYIEKEKPDALYKHNGRFNGVDSRTFRRRQAKGFGLGRIKL